MDVILERCGIDIGKDEVVACVRTPGPDGRGRRKETRTCLSFTGELEAMADWFATEVVMEATGSLETGVVCAGGTGIGVEGGQRPPRQDPTGAQERRSRRRVAGRVVGARHAAGQVSCPRRFSSTSSTGPPTATGYGRVHLSLTDRFVQAVVDMIVAAATLRSGASPADDGVPRC